MTKSLFSFAALLLAGAWLSAAAAAPILNVTPQSAPDFPEAVDLWIPGGTPVAGNINSEGCADSFSGRILRKLDRAPESGRFTARYEFDVPEEGDYLFFAALIQQGRAHASPVAFRFDDEPFRPVQPSNAQRECWGVSKAISWDTLGIEHLTAGKHSLEFEVTQKSQLGTWSFMCDGIAAIRTGGWKTIQIKQFEAPERAAAGETVELQLETEGGSALCEVLLSLGDDVAVRCGLFLRSGKLVIPFKLPDVLGANTYRLSLVPVEAPENILAERVIEIPRPVSSQPAASIAAVKADVEKYSIRFAAPAAAAGTACVAAEIDGKLYAVDARPFDAGATEVNGTYSEEFLQVVSGYVAQLFFRITPGGAEPEREIELRFPGNPRKLPIPFNNGVLADRDNVRHFWYIDRDHNYIFDGKPYTPFGGMWCPDTLLSTSTDPAAVNRNLDHDRQVLTALLSYDIRDFYLNMSSPAPVWVKQKFIDFLEENNVQYGYQLSAGSGDEVPCFFITRDKENPAGNYQVLLRGSYSGGKVVAELPKTYKVLGLLIVPDVPTPEWCRFVNFTDTEGKDQRSGIIDLETVQDFSDRRQVAFPAELPLAENSTVLLIPLLHSKLHNANLWSPERRAEIKQRMAWVGVVKWGGNLRCFVDPICNETNMVNGTENLRQYTDFINADFVKYLQDRYPTLDSLNRAWATGLPDYESAARIIPLPIADKLYLLDPAAGRVYRTDPEKSFAWIDYQDMIRTSYADYADEIAMELKRMADVPVIFKSVGVIGEKMSISRTYKGYDGVGFEVYLNQCQPEPAATGAGAARAEAEAAAHTMWKVGTEVGNSAAVQNDGVKFFKSEAELRTLTANLAKLGVKGFYYFGIDLKPGNLWSNHGYHDFPEGMEWVARSKRDFAQGTPATPRNYVFPGGYTWWWWTTRFQCVYGYEPTRLAQSVKIGNVYFSNTNVLPEEFNAVLVNLPRPPFSRYYAPEIERALNSGNKVYYVGSREDLGGIPALDNFFTSERISFPDGSSAQVLRAATGTEMLAAEDGRPWAIRNGNLTIVSREPETTTDHSGAEMTHYLREILEK